MGSEDDPDGLSIQSLEDLTQENLGLHATIDTLEKENEQLLGDIANIKDDRDYWESKYVNYECDCDDRSGEVEDLEDEVRELKHRIEELEDQLANRP